MHMQNTQKILIDIGLTEKEAAVYLTLLELGPSTVLEISKKAKVNRPTTYLEIESLKQKGLVSTQKKGAKQFFIAESPQQLKTNLDITKKDIEFKQTELKDILPDLTTLFQLAGDQPDVRYFEGKEGLLVMQQEFLKNKRKEIYGIFSHDALLGVFPNHKSDYTQTRIKKKITTKIIYTSSQGPILNKNMKAMLREAKFVPQEKFDFASDITIFDDSVAVSSLSGTVSGTLIKHPQVAKSFRGLFNLLWNCL